MHHHLFLLLYSLTAVTPSNTNPPVCFCRLMEMPVPPPTGVPGFGGAGRSDRVLRLSLPESHPNPRNRCASPAGW